MMDMTKRRFSQRALRCADWSWFEGMAIEWNLYRGAHGQVPRQTGARLATLADPLLPVASGVVDISRVPTGCWPDFDDLATVALLHVLVARAYNGIGCRTYFVESLGKHAVMVRVNSAHGNDVQIWFDCPSEHPHLEALVRALEHAQDPEADKHDTH